MTPLRTTGVPAIPHDDPLTSPHKHSLWRSETVACHARAREAQRRNYTEEGGETNPREALARTRLHELFELLRHVIRRVRAERRPHAGCPSAHCVSSATVTHVEAHVTVTVAIITVTNITADVSGAGLQRCQRRRRGARRGGAAVGYRGTSAVHRPTPPQILDAADAATHEAAPSRRA